MKVTQFFKKIGIWLAAFFGTSLEWLEEQAIGAVKIVNIIKRIVENPAIDVIVALTKSPLDDKILTLARNYLAQAAKEILLAEQILTTNASDEEILKLLTDFLSDKIPAARGKYYVELAGKITQILADGKVSISEAILLSQLVFAKIKKEG